MHNPNATISSVDLSKETIKHLFYKQVKDLTLRSSQSFDMQFSGQWLENNA